MLEFDEHVEKLDKHLESLLNAVRSYTKGSSDDEIKLYEKAEFISQNTSSHKEALQKVEGLKKSLEKAEKIVIEVAEIDSSKSCEYFEEKLRTEANNGALDGVIAEYGDDDKMLPVAVALVAMNKICDLSNVSSPYTTASELNSALKNSQTEKIAIFSRKFNDECEKLIKVVDFSSNLLKEKAFIDGCSQNQISKIKSLVTALENDCCYGSHAILGELATEISGLRSSILDQEGIYQLDDLIQAAKIDFDVHSKLYTDQIGLTSSSEALEEVTRIEFSMKQLMRYFTDIKNETVDPVYNTEISQKLNSLNDGIFFINADIPSVLAICKAAANQKELLSPSKKYEIVEKIAALELNFSKLLTATRLNKKEERIKKELFLSELERRKLESVIRADGVLKEISKGINDLVISKEEAPELLSKEESKADPIRAAAQELKVEASIWDSENNPIVSAVLKISKEVN